MVFRSPSYLMVHKSILFYRPLLHVIFILVAALRYIINNG